MSVWLSGPEGALTLCANGALAASDECPCVAGCEYPWPAVDIEIVGVDAGLCLPSGCIELPGGTGVTVMVESLSLDGVYRIPFFSQSTSEARYVGQFGLVTGRIDNSRSSQCSLQASGGFGASIFFDNNSSRVTSVGIRGGIAPGTPDDAFNPFRSPIVTMRAFETDFAIGGSVGWALGEAIPHDQALSCGPQLGIQGVGSTAISLGGHVIITEVCDDAI